MNYMEPMKDRSEDPVDRSAPPVTDRAPEQMPPKQHTDTHRGWGGRLFGVAVLLALSGGLAFGAWDHYSRYREVAAASELQRDLVPNVRVAEVRASAGTVVVNLPATTSSYAVANVYARASGYIGKREVDIGDQVKQGQLLAEIVAPELDHQIAQAEATLGQLKAALQQAEANKELARVTWERDRPLVAKGWVTAQQGTVDVQTLKAQEAAVGVAQANIAAQQAQLQVLNQQKAYQRVVAPFDGVITQRNIDIGSLVQADAANGTFLFTVMQGNVIRTQVYVPQDRAFGLAPGVAAVVHVPEVPNRIFPGKVTRIADALQPGTRTLLTEVDIPNPDGALTPGIYCTIDLHIPRKTPGLLVPADAVIFNSDGLQVAVFEDGVAHLHKITVARDLGKEVEVRDGVKPGDQVILNPSVDLVDGSKVQVRSKLVSSG
jgi:RND family efflux transporter MFP subunit